MVVTSYIMGENDTSLFDKYFDAYLLQIMYFGNPH